MPSDRNEAAEQQLRRMKGEGWIRRAVRLCGIAVAHAWRRGRFGRAPDLKRLLAAAPLEGIDLERPRAPGREIEF